MSLVFLPIAVAMLYLWEGWLAILLVGGFGLVCAVLLPVLYFRVFYIRANANGIEIRNQIGHRQFIPRDRIAAVSVGKTWNGGLSTSDYAFIVSPTGDQLGRFILATWNPEDFRRVANAVGLQLYGRPGRSLDQFHSAMALRHTALFYAKSMSAGFVIGCALPLLFVVAIGIVVLFRR